MTRQELIRHGVNLRQIDNQGENATQIITAVKLKKKIILRLFVAVHHSTQLGSNRAIFI